ncbi:MAG: hypothetical protein KDB27_31545, partial [Planctomycetales bacterium]|nr:hypothetical protein [Planctomycetales bacterium]
MGSVANADLTSFDVFPAFAPSGSSPSWDGYTNNAITGIAASGAPVGGDRDLDPTAYEPTAAFVSPHELIVSNYNSWRGKAAPNSLPAATVGEFGNRIHFGTRITSAYDTPFSLQDISFELDSDDVDDFFDLAGTFAGANYSSTRIGINYGDNKVPGGGDDVIFDSGESGNLPIHELRYVGVGTAFDASNTDPGTTGQEAINNIL